MTDVAVDTANENEGGGGPLTIHADPFAFFPGVASRIGGLGGAAPGHDPAYAFHTPYLQLPPGRATVTLHLAGLRAKIGTLHLRLHMMAVEEGARAGLVTSDRIKFNRLVVQGGVASISFDAYRDMSYALYGRVEEMTDAEAEALAIVFTSEGETDNRAALAEARRTQYGTDTVRPVARLISLERPRLGAPVSQPCTAAQTEEPTYAAALALLGETHRPSCSQWEAAYILQSLRAYGMVQAGARGLAFGVTGGSLPATLAREGASLLATGDAAVAADGRDMLESLRRPELGSSEQIERNLSYQQIDLTHVPLELVNFDFTWSARATDVLGSVAEAFTFVDTSLACLRPGGLAVHTFAYDMGAEGEEVLPGAVFRRADLERLALGLISRGHEVAQLKLVANDALPCDATAAGLVTSFGIIARKAITPL